MITPSTLKKNRIKRGVTVTDFKPGAVAYWYPVCYISRAILTKSIIVPETLFASTMVLPAMKYKHYSYDRKTVLQ